MYEQYGIFADLAGGIFVIYIIFILNKWINQMMKWQGIKERYIAIYEMFKLEEQLKERNLSFEQLDAKADEIHIRLYGKPDSRKKNDISAIDEQYKSDKKSK
jgi:hypothetical protein